MKERARLEDEFAKRAGFNYKGWMLCCPVYFGFDAAGMLLIMRPRYIPKSYFQINERVNLAFGYVWEGVRWLFGARWDPKVPFIVTGEL